MQQKIALVTGSSSGIGFQTSLSLAFNGIYTYASMRNMNKSKKIQDYAEENNLPLKTVHLDVTDEGSISDAIDNIMDEKDRIDILVNNAGYSLLGPLEQLGMKEVKEEFETNFFSIIKMIQGVLPKMRNQKYGRIVNISSVAGRIGFPFSSAYSSSKFALEGLIESIRYEVEAFGVYVSLIEPGVIKTEFLNNMKIGQEVVTSKNSNNISPYIELLQDRISSLKPRFEKGLPSSEVARIVLEAITSNKPKLRYLVGEDALKIIEKRKNTNDEEFDQFLMDSLLKRNIS